MEKSCLLTMMVATELLLTAGRAHAAFSRRTAPSLPPACESVLEGFNEPSKFSKFAEVSAMLLTSPGRMQLDSIGFSIPLENFITALAFTLKGVLRRKAGLINSPSFEPVRLYFRPWKQGVLFAITSMAADGGVMATFFNEMNQPEKEVLWVPRLSLDDRLRFLRMKSASNFSILKARRPANEAIGAGHIETYRIYFFVDMADLSKPNVPALHF